MDVDDAQNMPSEAQMPPPDEQATPSMINGATSSADLSGSTHKPSFIYAPYYTNPSELPPDQLSLFEAESFTDDLIPEAPPPFEHCYAPGEYPKQFEPKMDN